MRNIVENYSENVNFWEVNPQFTSILPFKNSIQETKVKVEKNLH